MAGDTRVLEDSYELEGVDVTVPFIFVVEGSGPHTCKIPTAAGDKGKILGIIQTTGIVGDQVLVRKIGTSKLKMNEAAAIGDRITCITTGSTAGYGDVDARPALAGDPPSTASVNALVDWIEQHPARAIEVAAAQHDLILVLLGAGMALR